jgi:hypothetical protein
MFVQWITIIYAKICSKFLLKDIVWNKEVDRWGTAAGGRYTSQYRWKKFASTSPLILSWYYFSLILNSSFSIQVILNNELSY